MHPGAAGESGHDRGDVESTLVLSDSGSLLGLTYVFAIGAVVGHFIPPPSFSGRGFARHLRQFERHSRQLWTLLPSVALGLELAVAVAGPGGWRLVELESG